MHWAKAGFNSNDTTYNENTNPTRQFLLAAGNRADLLIKAPTTGCAKPGDCPFMVKNEVDPQDLTTAQPLTLLSVVLTGSPVDPKSNSAQLIPNAPPLPVFLPPPPAPAAKAPPSIPPAPPP